MIAYVDPSVLLRVVLGQPDRLAEWSDIRHPVTSAITEVECLRTLDRRTRQGLLGEDELPERRALALRLLERIDRVEVTRAVLRRAADPFPTPLGTLDAIHLSTAVLWAELDRGRPTMATHDRQLGAAALAMGLEVVGVGG